MKKKLKVISFVLPGIIAASCSTVNVANSEPETKINFIDVTASKPVQNSVTHTAKVSEKPGATISFSITSDIPRLPDVSHPLQRGANDRGHLAGSRTANLSINNSSVFPPLMLLPLQKGESTSSGNSILGQSPGIPLMKGVAEERSQGMSTKASQNGTPGKTVNDIDHYLVYLIKSSTTTGYPAGGDPIGDAVAGPFTITRSGSAENVKFTNVQSSGTDAYYVAVRAQDSSNTDLIKANNGSATAWTGTTAATPAVAVSSGNGIMVNSSLQVSSTATLNLTTSLLDGTGARIDASITNNNGSLDSLAASVSTITGWNLSTLAITGIKAPIGMAVDNSGDIYIADANNNALKKFDGTTTTTLISSGLDFPNGVALDKDGNVYIADSDNNAIKKFDGTTTTTLVSSGLNLPNDVAVDKDGNVYIADTFNHQIKKFDVATNTTTTLVSSGLFTPLGIAVDKDGNVYFSDTGNHQIKKFDGTTTTTLGISGLTNPSSIAVDKDGNVYFAEHFDYHIKKFDGTTVTTLISGLSFPRGVAVDKDGNVYFGDNSYSVKKLTPVYGF